MYSYHAPSRADLASNSSWRPCRGFLPGYQQR